MKYVFFYRTHTQVFKHIKVSNVKLSLGSSAYIGLFFLNQKIMSYFCGDVYHFHKETCVWEDVYNLTKIELAGDEQSEFLCGPLDIYQRSLLSYTNVSLGMEDYH